MNNNENTVVEHHRDGGFVVVPVLSKYCINAKSCINT